MECPALYCQTLELNDYKANSIATRAVHGTTLSQSCPPFQHYPAAIETALYCNWVKPFLQKPTAIAPDACTVATWFQ